MNPEELELYKELQPLFKEKVGEIRSFDRQYCLQYNWTQVSLDCAYTGDEECNETQECKYRIQLPLPINPVNPERSLWGMIDWCKYHLEIGGPDGEVNIYKLPYIGQFGRTRPIIVDTPTLALLKVLKAQTLGVKG